MQLKHSNIDVETASKEEIKKEIIRLKNKYIQYQNEDLALKKLIVSSYGVIGNPSFFMYNPKIAGVITEQGRDIIKFVINAINKYFKDKWVKDYKIHKLMEIEVLNEVETDSVIYVATDSCFICFNDIIKSTNFNGEASEFILKLYDLRLKSYLNKILEIYSNKFNVNTTMALKLESISKTGILLGKNRYILDTIWEQGDIQFNSLENIINKGGELIKKDTSPFIRNKLELVIKFILQEGKKIDFNKLSLLARSIKNEFKLQDIENISFSAKLNDYENFILEDKINIETAGYCPVHIKAAAIYNYKLQQNPKFKEKYSLLNSDDNIKYYYTKSKFKDKNIFAFKIGNFPIEFAPELDYDLMFLKTFIEPVNKILKTLNITELNENLVVVDRWF